MQERTLARRNVAQQAVQPERPTASPLLGSLLAALVGARLTAALGLSSIMAWRSDITTILAVWGAVLSTVVFAWDIYKWRTSGPRLRFFASGNMETVNMPAYDGKTLVSARVTNVGDRSTTITNMAYLFYESRWAYLRRRSTKQFLVPTSSVAQPIPYELRPGTEWSGIAIQNEELETMAASGYLVCAVYHSHNQKPLTQRLVLKRKA